MKEWWNKLSANGQNVYLMRHPGSALKATKEIKPVDLPKDFDKSNFPKIVEAAKDAFESVDPYKEKLSSLGKKKIQEYATRIKEALKSETSKEAVRVGGELLFKMGLLTIGAGALAIGVHPIVVLNPFFIDTAFDWLKEESQVATTLANKTSSAARIVYDFCDGIFQGIREGIADPKKLEKAFIMDEEPPQIFVGKKPETASKGNFTNPADIIRAYAKIKDYMLELNSELASLNVTPLNISRAINIQTEIAHINRRVTMMQANYPDLNTKESDTFIVSASDKIKSILSQGKPELSSYIPRKFVKDIYVTYLQEQGPNLSFIRRATITELETKKSTVYVAIESASKDSITYAISDVKEQLPHLFETSSVAVFKSKLSCNLYGN